MDEWRKQDKGESKHRPRNRFGSSDRSCRSPKREEARFTFFCAVKLAYGPPPPGQQRLGNFKNICSPIPSSWVLCWRQHLCTRFCVCCCSSIQIPRPRAWRAGERDVGKRKELLISGGRRGGRRGGGEKIMSLQLSSVRYLSLGMRAKAGETIRDETRRGLSIRSHYASGHGVTGPVKR